MFATVLQDERPFCGDGVLDDAGGRGGGGGERGKGREGKGGGGGETVAIDMWQCPRCRGNSFGTRLACFGCKAPRPRGGKWVREWWRVDFLPRDVRWRIEEGDVENVWPAEGPLVPGPSGRMLGKGGAVGGGDFRGSGPPALPVGYLGKGVQGRGDTEGPRQVQAQKGSSGANAKGGQGEGGEKKGARQAGAGGSKGAAQPEEEGKGRDGLAHPPATRSKAKARPKGGDAPDTPQEEQGKIDEPWPEEVQPYVPPPMSRAMLDERYKALLQKREGLRQEDPRLEKTQERIEQTKQWLKDLGGRDANRVPFAMLDGRKELERCQERLRSAREELAEAKAEAARVLTREARAEASVRAWQARCENCKSKNAHLGFQAAVEACAGIEGYEELAQNAMFVEAALAAGGMQEAAQAYQQVSWFISQFGPKVYNKKEDPLLQDLSSVESGATTIDIDALGGTEDVPGAPELAIPLTNVVQPGQGQPVCWQIDTHGAQGPPGEEEQQKGMPPREDRQSCKQAVRSKIGKEKKRGASVAANKSSREHGVDEGRRMEVEEARRVDEEMEQEDSGGPFVVVRRRGREKRDRSRSSTATVDGGRGRSRRRSRAARGWSCGKVRSCGEGAMLVPLDGGGGEVGASKSGEAQVQLTLAIQQAASAKEGKKRGKKKRWASEESVGAQRESGQQRHEYCRACGDGPWAIEELRHSCACGAPICDQCQGSNACERCNKGA